MNSLLSDRVCRRHYDKLKANLENVVVHSQMGRLLGRDYREIRKPMMYAQGRWYYTDREQPFLDERLRRGISIMTTAQGVAP